MDICKNVLSGGGYLIDWGGSNLYHILRLLYKAFIDNQLIWSLTASDMPTLTKVACICSLKGKIDFKNLLVLQKCLKTSLEQNIFSFHLLSIRLGGFAIIRGGRTFSKSSQIGGGVNITMVIILTN